jgi:hypothetical protein
MPTPDCSRKSEQLADSQAMPDDENTLFDFEKR